MTSIDDVIKYCYTSVYIFYRKPIRDRVSVLSHTNQIVNLLYLVVFLFSFSSSCVPYVARFSGLSIFDGPFDIF